MLLWYFIVTAFLHNVLHYSNVECYNNAAYGQRRSRNMAGSKIDITKNQNINKGRNNSSDFMNLLNFVNLVIPRRPQFFNGNITRPSTSQSFANTKEFSNSDGSEHSSSKSVKGIKIFLKLLAFIFGAGVVVYGIIRKYRGKKKEDEEPLTICCDKGNSSIETV